MTASRRILRVRVAQLAGQPLGSIHGSAGVGRHASDEQIVVDTAVGRRPRISGSFIATYMPVPEFGVLRDGGQPLVGVLGEWLVAGVEAICVAARP